MRMNVSVVRRVAVSAAIMATLTLVVTLAVLNVQKHDAQDDTPHKSSDTNERAYEGTLARRENTIRERGRVLPTLSYVITLDEPTEIDALNRGASGSEKEARHLERVTSVRVGGVLVGGEGDDASEMFDSHWEPRVGQRVRVVGSPYYDEKADKDHDAAEVQLDEASYADEDRSHVEPREDPTDYTWQELSAIADDVRMTSGGSARAGASVEERLEYYGLADDGGQLRDVVKEVVLSDGSTISCKLVDAGRVEATTGQNKLPTGLTFMCTGDSLVHPFAGANGVRWTRSTLRDWLNRSVIAMMPKELAESIVLSCKHGGTAEPLPQLLKGEEADAGKAYGVDWHGPDDYLWVPSISELAGEVDWEWASDPMHKSVYDALLNEEGQWFRRIALERERQNDKDFDGSGPRMELAWGDEYWTRSVSPSSGRPLVISPTGEVGGASDASESRKVLFCFNLGVPRHRDGYKRGVWLYPDSDDVSMPAWHGDEDRPYQVVEHVEPSRDAKADGEKHGESTGRSSNEREETESDFEKDAVVEDSANDNDSATIDAEAEVEVTLEGSLYREVSRDDSAMQEIWYMLRLDRPRSFINLKGMSSSTVTTDKVRVSGATKYLSFEEPVAIDELVNDKWEGYVGQRVACTGKLVGMVSPRYAEVNLSEAHVDHVP